MMQLVPEVSSLTPLTTFVPLIAVLTVSLIKDAIDDYVSLKTEKWMSIRPFMVRSGSSENICKSLPKSEKKYIYRVKSAILQCLYFFCVSLRLLKLSFEPERTIIRCWGILECRIPLPLPLTTRPTISFVGPRSTCSEWKGKRNLFSHKLWQKREV